CGRGRLRGRPRAPVGWCQPLRRQGRAAPAVGRRPPARAGRHRPRRGVVARRHPRAGRGPAPVGRGVIPAPGPHGGDGGRVAAALGLDPAAVLDLSLSLNPVAPDARELVGKHLDAVLRYPDPAPATEALAAAIGVDPERLLLTNGGAEAIALVAAEVGGGVAREPDF